MSRSLQTKAYPLTINSSELDLVRSLATKPLKLKGADVGPGASESARQEALARRDKMQKLDTQKLKEKVSKGAADEEQVEMLVEEMCE